MASAIGRGGAERQWIASGGTFDTDFPYKPISSVAVGECGGEGRWTNLFTPLSRTEPYRSSRSRGEGGVAVEACTPLSRTNPCRPSPSGWGGGRTSHTVCAFPKVKRLNLILIFNPISNSEHISRLTVGIPNLIILPRRGITERRCNSFLC